MLMILWVNRQDFGGSVAIWQSLLSNSIIFSLLKYGNYLSFMAREDVFFLAIQPFCSVPLSPPPELCYEENTFLSFILLNMLEINQLRFSNLDVYGEESERHGLFNECPIFQGFLSMHCPFPSPGK